MGNQEKQIIIVNLEKIDCKLQCKLGSYYKKPIIMERRKPIIEETLKHLKNSSTTNYNIMIDAETGFGKTYDIGLWSDVLAQAGVHHLVAVSSNDLVSQAKEIIGDTFYVDIRTPKTMQEIKDVLRTDKSTTIIVTHDLLLQREDSLKFEDQNDEKPKLWISIDEADSIIMQQAFENICKLDNIYNTTYLTATPKKRILNRCGKIISPSRSSRSCIVNIIRAEGIIAKTNKRSKFIQALVVNIVVVSIFYIISNYLIRDYFTIKINFTVLYPVLNRCLSSLLQYTVHHVVFSVIMMFCGLLVRKIIGLELKDLFLRIQANLASVIIQEKSSPAHEYVEGYEELFNYNKLVDNKDLLTLVRWNIQSPIGENALILVNDVDSIINLNSVLQDNDNFIYEDGKIYTRYEVYDKFKPTGMLYRDYRLKLRQSNFIHCVKKQYHDLTGEQISELTEKVDFSNTTKYLKYRVMHSMIDLTLSYLTEQNNIDLDKRRRENLDGLIEIVKGKVGAFNDNSIIAFLQEKGFTREFARDELLPQIDVVIGALNKSNSEQYKLIVDNWHLSKKLHDFIEEGVLHGLSDFCEENKCIFMGIRKNDLGIDERKPFFKLYNSEIISGKNKYKAKYCNYGQGDLNVLAKCALTTIVDGSKGRGFDSDYNHVASIFTNSISEFNNPAEVLQNLGRNREHNTNRQSWFFVAADERVELCIDKVLVNLKSLPKDFCTKFLFPANDRYNKLVKNSMGVELGYKIEIYISKNMDELGDIDDEALKIFFNGLIKEAYEKICDINDFNIKKTEKDLYKILKNTEKYLHLYDDRIKGKFSFMNRAVFFSISIILKAVYYIWFAFDHVIFIAKSCTLNEKTDGQNVLTYAYIVKNYSLEHVLRFEKILYKAFELAEDTYQNYKYGACFHTFNYPKFMERIVGLFQNKIYIHALDKLFSPLLLRKGGDEHLLIILNVIYPDMKDNKNKQEKIVNLIKDFKELSCDELVNKYCQESTYQNTDLYKIFTWINDINQEVINCQAYYYGVNSLINVCNPRLKIDHPLFDIRVVYSMERFKSSYIKPLNKDYNISCFVGLYYIARYIIVNFLFPSFLLRFITQKDSIIITVAGMVLTVLTCVYPEETIKFLFNENIQNESRSAINELNLLSKQSEVKYMREVANMIVTTDLSSILVQQQTASEQQSI